MWFSITIFRKITDPIEVYVSDEHRTQGMRKESCKFAKMRKKPDENLVQYSNLFGRQSIYHHLDANTSRKKYVRRTKALNLDWCRMWRNIAHNVPKGAPSIVVSYLSTLTAMNEPMGMWIFVCSVHFDCDHHESAMIAPMNLSMCWTFCHFVQDLSFFLTLHKT